MSQPQLRPLGAPRRVVVKVGTAVVTRPGRGLALGRIGALVEQLAAQRREGREILLVSSGAVGLGAARLGFTARPSDDVDRQACAAAGQGALIALYDTLLRQEGQVCAQVLLTEDDFLHRARYLNLHATLDRLLALKAIPVINENDTVSTAEIALHQDAVFGDNDRLSALVAAGVHADLLVLLTDVPGLYTDHPSRPGAERIATFGDAPFTLGEGSAGGRGGMGAKIAAARVANSAGVQVVVASGGEPDVLARVLAGEPIGTWFPAGTQALSSRRRWLAFATAPEGRVLVNAGAAEALVTRGASLLPTGVTGIEGRFDEGGVVEIVGPDGRALGRGLAAFEAGAARRLVGEPAGSKQRPLVHRNDLVLIDAR
jgi:glutamate 5-kinase